MVFRILRPEAGSVWKNDEILKRFQRYKGILDNRCIARYILAKSIECKFEVSDSLESLKEKLKKGSKELNELLLEETKNLEAREMKSSSFIDLAEHIAKKYLEKCNFCERNCGIDRTHGEKGYCLIPEESYLSSGFLHWGEESVLVPSGTLFFQGCNFGCVFCQNYDISQSWKKKRNIEDIAQIVDAPTLARAADKLVQQGAININYVGGDPIPNIHTIIGSLKYQKNNICQLWNSNFYLTNDSLDLLIDLMDFWLPDFKYGNNECGEKLSLVKNYYDIITRNLKRIHDEGSGEIVIRHLVMPNHVECCSKPILDYIAKEAPKCVVNIMGQYRPEYKALSYSYINRRPTSEEMMEVKDYANKLGILFKPVS